MVVWKNYPMLLPPQLVPSTNLYITLLPIYSCVHVYLQQRKIDSLQ